MKYDREIWYKEKKKSMIRIEYVRGESDSIFNRNRVRVSW
jgi:hypothetical protein